MPIFRGQKKVHGIPWRIENYFDKSGFATAAAQCPGLLPIMEISHSSSRMCLFLTAPNSIQTRTKPTFSFPSTIRFRIITHFNLCSTPLLLFFVIWMRMKLATIARPTVSNRFFACDDDNEVTICVACQSLCITRL